MLLAAHTDAYLFYRSNLARSWVPAYLQKRGITAELQEQWGAGYAPPEWTSLTSYLRSRGYWEHVIEASGLAFRSRHNSLVDTFRNRLILPVRDPQHGQVIAFIGRLPDDQVNAGNPKYMNSPNTLIYQKSQVLYGLFEARKRLAAGARAVVEEGPTDVIAASACSSALAGVAACGTAFTAKHAAALAQASGPGELDVVIATDADRAGWKGATAAYWKLAAVTTQIRGAGLSGPDPATLFEADGAAALTAALTRDALPMADIVTNSRFAELATDYDGHTRLATAEGTLTALRGTAQVIATMPPAHWRRQATRLASMLSEQRVTTLDAMVAIADAIPAAGSASLWPLAARPAPPAAARPAAATAAAGFPVARRPSTATQPATLRPRPRRSSAAISLHPDRQR